MSVSGFPRIHFFTEIMQQNSYIWLNAVDEFVYKTTVLHPHLEVYLNFMEVTQISLLFTRHKNVSSEVFLEMNKTHMAH